MSILIKGMKMPKTCMNGGCPIDGKYCDLWWKAGGGSYGRHRDCPLIELPDHGDLIDRDALNDAMYHEAFETDSEWQKWDSGCWIRYKMFERHRDLAPVVIPAERREDETD